MQITDKARVRLTEAIGTASKESRIRIHVGRG